MKIYTNAKLSNIDSLGIRIGGAGLGNILFPWARSVVYAYNNNCGRINATWRTLKIGTYIRGENDKRTYHNLFKEDGIRGLKKFFLLLVAQHVNENNIDQNLKPRFRPIIISFEGMKNQMQDILNYDEIVKKALIEMVRPIHLKNSELHKPKGIGMHVRLGDFYEPRDETEIRNGVTNCRIPIKWYIEIIQNIRKTIGKELEVSVFSDGTEEELREILKLSNVALVGGASSISDLLSLSKSEILIASNSTFSLWASYLGRIPTVWFPGTHRIKLYKESESAFEFELDYHDEVPRGLLKYIKKNIF